MAQLAEVPSAKHADVLLPATHVAWRRENFRHNGKITGCENATQGFMKLVLQKSTLPKVKTSFTSLIFCVESPRIKYDLRIIVQIRLYILNLELVSRCKIKLATKNGRNIMFQSTQVSQCSTILQQLSPRDETSP